jgi:hypothetical protein
LNLTRPAIANPVAVIVGIIMVLMFGTIALVRMPIQMIPNVERPLIEINTRWRSAAPEEVEAEIVEPQEDALRGLPGLEKVESSASRGNASITLYFGVDTRLERSLIEVMNRLNRVPSYPPDVDEPVIYAGRGRFGTAIAWFAIKPLPGNNRDITGYQDFVEEVIQSKVEQIPGIATADIYGGRNREVRITFDPYQTAALGVEIPTLARLTGNNTDVSGGFQDVGRRSYTVRFSGKYSVESFNDMVLAWRDGQPVHLYDIASVETVLRDATGTLNQNGGPSMAMNAQPEQNVNVLEVMDELKATIAALDEGPVGRAGLSITQVYDETIYITDSIAMLRNNLVLGIFLAIAVLWWFMRRFRATMMVALAIPVSLFVTFIVLNAAGRTINIISLAGLAFAVGMVLDAAIVVLENIVRLREKGSPSDEAALRGTSQVWGALVASTATTVAIFLPIVFLNRRDDYPDGGDELAAEHRTQGPSLVMVAERHSTRHAPHGHEEETRGLDRWPQRHGHRTDLDTGPGDGLPARRRAEFHVRRHPASARNQRRVLQDGDRRGHQRAPDALSARRERAEDSELLPRTLRTIRVHGSTSRGSRRSRRADPNIQRRNSAWLSRHAGVHESRLNIRSPRGRPIDRRQHPEPRYRRHAGRRYGRDGVDLAEPAGLPGPTPSRCRACQPRAATDPR